MSEWRWISGATVVAIHDEQLAEHGGPAGLRNEGGLCSALARPQNLAAYQESDAAALAASYAYGIARNHPFVDGNKRTAWVIARLFLAKNGCELRFIPAEAIDVMLRLAASEIEEEELASWFRERTGSR